MIMVLALLLAPLIILFDLASRHQSKPAVRLSPDGFFCVPGRQLGRSRAGFAQPPREGRPGITRQPQTRYNAPKTPHKARNIPAYIC